LEDTTSALSDCDGYDPYKYDELDPSKSNAVQSSLWEIQTLAQHYAPTVSRLTKIFEGDFNKKYYEFEAFLEESHQSIFDSEVNRKAKGNVPVEYKPKLSLFGADISNLPLQAKNSTTDEDSFSLWKF